MIYHDDYILRLQNLVQIIREKKMRARKAQARELAGACTSKTQIAVRHSCVINHSKHLIATRAPRLRPK